MGLTIKGHLSNEILCRSPEITEIKMRLKWSALESKRERYRCLFRMLISWRASSSSIRSVNSNIILVMKKMNINKKYVWNSCKFICILHSIYPSIYIRHSIAQLSEKRYPRNYFVNHSYFHSRVLLFLNMGWNGTPTGARETSEQRTLLMLPLVHDA